MTDDAAIGQIRTMADVLRRIPRSSGESAPSPTSLPKGLPWASARPGPAPLVVDWFVAWEDSTGKLMASGSATVQWYVVDWGADGGVNVSTLGPAVAATHHVLGHITVPTGMYAWPIATSMSAPSVTAKSEKITITGNADGTYSIAVIGEVDPYEFEASGNTNEEIRDGLVALFAAHPTLTVYASGDGEITVSAQQGGVDFEIDVDGPGDSMAEEPINPYTPGPSFLRIYTATAQAQAITVDATAMENAAKAGAASALTDANLSYDNIAGAAASAIQTQVNNGVIPSDLDLDACKPPTLQKYGGEFGDAGTENEIISAPSPGNRIAIYGWIATRDGDAMQIELRSGSIGANTAMAGAPAKFTIGGGSAINLTPGMQPLWHGLPDEKIVLQRSAGSKPFHFAVWYRTVPPA